ncbi:MAG: FlgD immunoglobulin-like domain containing protein [Candidatus Eisenbacteria bacterium]
MNDRTARPRVAAMLARAILAPCAALILAGLVPSLAGSGENHPRLGLYGHCDGRGLPIVRSDGTVDRTLIGQIARRHMVVLDATPFTEYRSDVLDSLRARRSDIQLLGYVQAEYIWRSSEADSTVNIPTQIRILVRNLDGYLYNKTGIEYVSANINLAKRDAQGRLVVAEAMADFFVDKILATGHWDGLFFDRFTYSIAYMQSFGDSIDFQRAGYPTFEAFDASWKAGTDTLANRMRRRAGDAPLLVGNGGQGNNKAATCNGWMREGWPNQNGATWASNMFWQPGGYLYDQGQYREPYAGWLVAWPSDNLAPYSAENMRRNRWALGSASLGDGYGTMNPPQLDPFTGYLSWWFDEFAVDRITGNSTGRMEDTGWLGGSTGPWYQMLWVQPDVPDATAENPDFENSVTTGWTMVTTVGSTVERDTTTAGHGIASARIHVPLASDNLYTTKFTSNGSVFYIAETYSATFWAKTSVPRTIYVASVKPDGSPWWMKVIAIGTTWRQYQVTFEGQLGEARLQFYVGGTIGDVWLDDVHFQLGEATVYRRDFDYGTVLVNPSLEVYDVAMEKKYRRINGLLDRVVNNGSESTLIRVRPSDAVFLLKSLEDLIAVPRPAPAAGLARLAWSAVSPSPARAGAETIRLSLAVSEPLDAGVVLFDARGRRVRTVFTGSLVAGTHVFTWDGRDEGGRTAAPGLYFARARAGTSEVVRKLVCR